MRFSFSRISCMTVRVRPISISQQSSSTKTEHQYFLSEVISTNSGTKSDTASSGKSTTSHQKRNTVIIFSNVVTLLSHSTSAVSSEPTIHRSMSSIKPMINLQKRLEITGKKNISSGICAAELGISKSNTRILAISSCQRSIRRMSMS